MKVGFISGVFDMVHQGHGWCLLECARQCDHLIVAINCNDCIRRKKKREPVMSSRERRNKILELGLVQSCFVYFDDSPAELINIIRPDIIFAGDDYPKEKIVGFDSGAEIIIIPRIPNISTTELLKNEKI